MCVLGMCLGEVPLVSFCGFRRISLFWELGSFLGFGSALWTLPVFCKYCLFYENGAQVFYKSFLEVFWGVLGAFHGLGGAFVFDFCFWKPRSADFKPFFWFVFFVNGMRHRVRISKKSFPFFVGADGVFKCFRCFSWSVFICDGMGNQWIFDSLKTCCHRMHLYMSTTIICFPPYFPWYCSGWILIFGLFKASFGEHFLFFLSFLSNSKFQWPRGPWPAQRSLPLLQTLHSRRSRVGCETLQGAFEGETSKRLLWRRPFAVRLRDERLLNGGSL